jgi:nucleotidyltransferase/DNA polymerase involved in DNA repair
MKGHEILLCDLDAFFASVEQRDHPETGENRSLSAADQTSAAW